MTSILKKKFNKKGFTLAELLIVVAIIAVLVAIAVPVFSSQLESSREAVDRANARSANSIATATYLMYEGKGEITFAIGMDTDGNVGIQAQPTTDGSTTSLKTIPAGSLVTTAITNKSQKCKDTTLTVKVKDGKVTDNTWLDKLNATT